ncbi:MAG: hypothetical protein IJR11_07190 [Synergistaceae bacterium]|nr:hypothetical protein [Synergistaceae bacterium]
MGIRDFFARHVTRSINVYRIDDFSVEPPVTVRASQRVNTKSLKPMVSCNASRPRGFVGLQEKMKVPAKKIKFADFKASSKNMTIKKYVKEDVKTQRHSLGQKPKTLTMLKQLQSVPQERANILKFIKKRPELAKGEVVLACYGPIVEGSVLKLVLNKQQGTLLVWYKSGSRQLKAKNVYLIRRLGLGEKPEWRWL